MQLVSFKLCPFVQRSVITLLYKDIPFDITYIDLDNPPDWFTAISPLGKVPLLQVDQTVLFESAVINEYVDETSPPALHPSDPMQKALNRAWIEFGSDLIANQYMYFSARTEERMERFRQMLFDKLQMLEKNLHCVPFFNGEQFSLVDAAFAPLFMRFELLPDDFYKDTPKVQAWAAHLAQQPYVQQSVVDDLADLFAAYLQQINSVLASQ